jgi:hypothetical protein
MNKKRRTLQVIKQFFHRSVEPTSGDKRFRRALLCSFGLFVLSLCVLWLSGLAPFSVWLMYGALYLMIGLECVAIIWRVWDITKQMKGNDWGNR